MKKEPSKTQGNGISDAGIPMSDDILHRLVKGKDAGKEYMAATREKLMCLLKEYLGQKYGHKVRFILPPGDPVGDLLDGKDFYPCSVTIYDKFGFAACSSAVSVELTAEGKILIPTDEAGKIHDAEELLSNDDLLALCGTIEEYERLLPEIRKELAENGDWKEFARRMLAEEFPLSDNKVREEFILKHWENLQAESYNLQRFKRHCQENNEK